MKLFIISGRSGSGKSTVLESLEDHGYQCIDNLPVTLLHSLVEENLNREGAVTTQLAVCIDCLLYTSPSPRDGHQSRMPSSA